MSLRGNSTFHRFVEPVSLVATLTFGLPTAEAQTIAAAATTEVRVTPRDDGGATLDVRHGSRTAHLVVPHGVAGAHANRVAFDDGPRSVDGVLVETEGEGAEVIVLDASLRELAREPLGDRGDVGERVRRVLRIETIEGHPRLVRGAEREHVTTCGSSRALLFGEVFERGRFVSLPRAAITSLEGSIAGSTPTAEPPAPRLGRLRWRGASSLDGVTAAADLGAPTMLADGRVDTAWFEGEATGSGAGEFVVAEWDGPPLSALMIRWSDDAGSRPESVVVQVDGHAFAATIPATGEMAELRLPTPIEARCVAISLGASRARGARRVGFAEVRGLSSEDGEPGVRRAVERIVAEPGSREGWSAIHSAGEMGLAMLAEAWDRLDASSRARAATLAGERTGAIADTLLWRGLEDGTEEVRRDAARAAIRSGDRRPALASLAVEETPRGAALRDAFGELRVPLDRAVVEPWLAAVGAGTRTVLTLTANAAARREHRELVASWSSGADREAALTLGYAMRQAHAAPETMRALLPGTDGLASFEDRYRAVIIAGHAQPEGETSTWLAGLARSADEWMLRDAALEALGDGASFDLSVAASSDAAPRVRARAAARLAAIARADGADRGRAHETLVAWSDRETWPAVRGPLLAAIAGTDDGDVRVRRALVDDTSGTRLAAIEIVAARRERDDAVLAGIGRILGDAREWPHVTAAALHFADRVEAEQVCESPLEEGLLAVIRRGVGATAPERDLELAIEAIRIGRRFGPRMESQIATLVARGGRTEELAPALARPVRACGTATPPSQS